MIEVKIFATLRDGREKSYSLPSERYKTPADIMNYLNIPPNGVAILLINGFHAEISTQLKDNDIVSMFPPCAGG